VEKEKLLLPGVGKRDLFGKKSYTGSQKHGLFRKKGLFGNAISRAEGKLRGSISRGYLIKEKMTHKPREVIRMVKRWSS